MDEKLSLLSETIRKFGVELQSMGKRLDKAEARLLANETSATSDEARVSRLQNHNDELTEKLDTAENYNRCLNVRLLGRRYGDGTPG